jgi:hypothetical protein
MSSLLLQKRDEREEALAVQAVLVEIVGLAVGRRDHHHALGEKRLEEPAQDHGVGDVVDIELVEAEQGRLGRDPPGDRRDRIALLAAALVDTLVHLQHEGVEMDAALQLDRRGLEEHVHDHGLAAADAAVDVEAERRRLGGGCQAEPRAPAMGAVVGRVGQKRAPQALQLLDGQLLGGIGQQNARRAACPVKRERAVGGGVLLGEARRCGGRRGRHRGACHSEIRPHMQNSMPCKGETRMTHPPALRAPELRPATHRTELPLGEPEEKGHCAASPAEVRVGDSVPRERYPGSAIC